MKITQKDIDLYRDGKITLYKIHLIPLLEQNLAMQKALEYYADKNNLNEDNAYMIREDKYIEVYDECKTAQNALKELEK